MASKNEERRAFARLTHELVIVASIDIKIRRSSNNITGFKLNNYKAWTTEHLCKSNIHGHKAFSRLKSRPL